jgi:hypothetical protein
MYRKFESTCGRRAAHLAAAFVTTMNSGPDNLSNPRTSYSPR